MFYAIKIALSAFLILLISEISKKSALIGAILASVPLISVIAIIWLYLETKDLNKISNLSINIFWLVFPSLTFFITLPVLLKCKISFAAALPCALIVMVLFYFLTILILKKFGIFIN